MWKVERFLTCQKNNLIYLSLFIGPIYQKNVMVMLGGGMMYQLCRQYGPGGENEWAALRGCQVIVTLANLDPLGLK
jgi:hypothetical protein